MKKSKTSSFLTYQYFRNYNQISFLDYSLHLPEYRTQNIYNDKLRVLIRDFYYNWMNSNFYFTYFRFSSKLSQDIKFLNTLVLKKCYKTQLHYQIHLYSKLKPVSFSYSMISNCLSLYNSQIITNTFILNFNKFSIFRILFLIKIILFNLWKKNKTLDIKIN